MSVTPHEETAARNASLQEKEFLVVQEPIDKSCA
jgi:hypothetical protein